MSNTEWKNILGWVCWAPARRWCEPHRCRCWPRAAAGRTCAGVSARDPSLTTNNAELNAQLLFFISQCLSYLIVYIVTFKYLLTTYRARKNTWTILVDIIVILVDIICPHCRPQGSASHPRRGRDLPMLGATRSAGAAGSRGLIW